MATKIQWTEETWNPIVGCSIATPGCTNCYAMRMAWRLANNPATPHYAGTVEKVNGKPVWTGKVALAPDRVLAEPLRRRKPTMYFVNSMGDLFHEDVPDEWIDKVFAVMALAPQHTFQVLTKRAARMREYITARRFAPISRETNGLAYAFDKGDLNPIMVESMWPLPNVWLGVSAERQKEWDERKEDLRQTPAAVRFASFEPLLGAIEGVPDWLDWGIVGGESGPGARVPEDFETAARSLRDQCAAASVAFFMKQMPKKTPIPADLMVREFPT